MIVTILLVVGILLFTMMLFTKLIMKKNYSIWGMTLRDLTYLIVILTLYGLMFVLSHLKTIFC